jgi:hypothetical protein
VSSRRSVGGCFRIPLLSCVACPRTSQRARGMSENLRYGKRKFANGESDSFGYPSSILDQCLGNRYEYLMDAGIVHPFFDGVASNRC